MKRAYILAIALLFHVISQSNQSNAAEIAAGISVTVVLWIVDKVFKNQLKAMSKGGDTVSDYVNALAKHPQTQKQKQHQWTGR